jgi:hypothetical protein
VEIGRGGFNRHQLIVCSCWKKGLKVAFRKEMNLRSHAVGGNDIIRSGI